MTLIENLNKESAETRSKFSTEKAKATKAELEPCFAAGTLVHTINGLVPIEQIKVGDLVLSKPEDGGEQSYKPVTKTFEHDFKEVIALEVDFSAEPRDIYDLTAKPSGGTLQDSNGNRFKYIVADENNPTGGSKSEWIISTWNHPFFVKKQFEKVGYDHPNGVKPEWVKLCQMEHGDEIEAFNGKTARVHVVENLHRTYEYDPNFAVANYSGERTWDHGYYLIDLHARPLMGKFVDYSPQFGGSMPQVQITVYNFEVQDNHTYYVGEIGLWVHNKNTRLKVLDEKQAELLIKGENPGEVFYIKENKKQAWLQEEYRVRRIWSQVFHYEEYRVMKNIEKNIGSGLSLLYSARRI